MRGLSYRDANILIKQGEITSESRKKILNFSASLRRVAKRLTASESKLLGCLYLKAGEVCSRDDLAKSLWGEEWIDKYSDWMIDRVIYQVRRKLRDGYKIITMRGKGYVLVKSRPDLEDRDDLIQAPKGTLPSSEYLEYMNDPKKLRKTLKDLFLAVKKFNLSDCISTGKMLVINSYSFDNVDAVSDFEGEVIFTNFDERALEIHRNRIEELGLRNIRVIYDDIRESRLKDKNFNIVINDFRLNFNTDHWQNRKAVMNMRRVLADKGIALVSVITDKRKRKFVADENLVRWCYSLDYYRKLFRKSGFKIIKEFDIKEGREWYKKLKIIKPGNELTYRRFLLQAI